MIEQETILRGIPVSDGIAIGMLYLIETKDPEVLEFEIETGEVENEITRFKNALNSSKKELHLLQMTLEETGINDAATIIDSHIQMLDDPQLKKTVEGKIRERQQNTESVFRSVVSEYETQFLAFEDDYFRQRILDIKDLSKRVLMHLNPDKTVEENQYPDACILFSQELVPSVTASAISRKVKAFLSHHGGGTSHTALIARACGIPFVSDINREDLLQANGSTIIIDGTNGIVILNPSEESLAIYEEAVDEYQFPEEGVPGQVKTKDGVAVQVMANISTCESLEQQGCVIADGVGLVRTEFVALGKEIESLSEEVQLSEYKKLYEAFGEKPLVFRVFDFGAEKKMHHLHKKGDEQNPALGLRAIRYLLSEEFLFRTQLRAMLKASSQKTLRLLFPLIADPSDMRVAKAITEEEKNKLLKHQQPEIILYGAMIELPSAVLLCEEIARECNFLSIGSNDLTQYTLGIDRANKNVNSLYGKFHPSLIRSLDAIMKVAEKTKIPVSLCGEIASELRYTKLLIGLGLTQFSCSPRSICAIKSEIELISQEEAKSLAEKARNCSSSEELELLIG